MGIVVTTTKARYDGIADWYDAYNARTAGSHAVEFAALLGPGDGLCLDLGCGTGQYLDAIRGTGRAVVGLDCSADQLRLAGTRGASLVRADAAALPFTGSDLRRRAIVGAGRLDGWPPVHPPPSR
jgi:ubiquinone/menaquinone biosynthesis C-methylase UbiE